MRIRICVVPLLLAVSLGLSFPVALAAGSGQVDPCSLLTKAEIQEVLGKPVSDGKLNTKANPLVGQPCQYTVGGTGAFSILVKTAGASETPDAIIAGLRQMKIKTSDATPGIGDRSFFSHPGYGMLQLNTFKGSRYAVMTLMVPGLTEDAQKAPAEKLMRKILPKL